MRQIMRSRLWSISHTSLRNAWSNRLWFRRSDQSRCIVASSRSGAAMAAPNPTLNSAAEPAVVTMASYRVTHSAQISEVLLAPIQRKTSPLLLRAGMRSRGAGSSLGWWRSTGRGLSC